MRGTRLCQRDDLRSIVQLSQLWADEGTTRGQEVGALAFFEARLGHYFWVAEDDSAIVGFICGSAKVSEGLAVIPKGEAYLEIEELYVHPSHRCEGLGSQLLDRLLAEAAASGVTRSLVYSATREWQRIVSFYERHGFKMWFVEMYR